MCIRDGRKAIGAELARENPVDADLIIPVPDSGTPAAIGYCLLYTSDAADERSSVDLGGRRIIKKKNT